MRKVVTQILSSRWSINTGLFYSCPSAFIAGLGNEFPAGVYNTYAEKTVNASAVSFAYINRPCHRLIKWYWFNGADCSSFGKKFRQSSVWSLRSRWSYHQALFSWMFTIIKADGFVLHPGRRHRIRRFFDDNGNVPILPEAITPEFVNGALYREAGQAGGG